MKHITYTTEKLINKMKKNHLDDTFNRPLLEKVVITMWDDIFSDHSYYGGTLKELEKHLGRRIDNRRQQNIWEIPGIYGLEHVTKGNARYAGTHDLSYINVEDFNALVKQAYDKGGY